MMSAQATSPGHEHETTRHLDWYDRRILAFVVDRHPDKRLSERECRSWFGITPPAVIRRFNAVVDVYMLYCVPLDDEDQDLIDRAARYRISAERSA